ncbi:hypothetical protein EGR_02896 [Echinococcus granulosus]|uniref:GDPGP1-like N-terminal domain-containing protein n=1 Tax=Echinococcus granulosus TaxID=6210 RepID=W6V6U8_ECHGR|nr:hypothetical protein EGR_02896 [Echinococcus granulosus]EUB62144.1 hypothetical protein EGR_02896 [Echinococcus granulosus]
MATARRLAYTSKNLVWSITGMEGEILMNRFNKRREPSSFEALDEPCPVNEFNFTKLKSSEKLFQISFQELGTCYGLVVANASPFMLGHSLIVPNPEDLLNQPTRKKSSLPFYDELDSHPVDNFVFEFRTLDELQMSFGRLWDLVERCQEMKIAHNLFAARNATGALRVVVWPRRSVYGAKACQHHPVKSDECVFNVAVAELAGMFVVPDEATAHPLSLPSGLHEVYISARLDRQEITQLETLLLPQINSMPLQRVPHRDGVVACAGFRRWCVFYARTGFDRSDVPSLNVGTHIRG